jgi:diguanylate cyclase (GGDEF)-like protein
VSSPWHPLLLRQLRRVGMEPAQWPSSGPMADLLERVSRAYQQHDQGRYLMERSQDIATRELSELNARLQASQARLSSLVTLSSDWICEMDARMRFTYLSKEVQHSSVVAADFIGHRPDLRGLPPVPGHDPDELDAKVLRREPFRNFVFGLKTKAGEVVYLRISGEPVFEQGQFTGYRGVASDVTQATLADQQVVQLASYDGLTGLANRNLFMAELHRAMASAARANESFALFFIDLDRFKAVNDSLGHDAGDELLKVMAGRLTTLLRDADIVARLGGDEFVVLVDGQVDPSALSKVASRMLTVLCEPFELRGRAVQISASVGIAVYPADGQDEASLLKNADAAMYLAKAKGKNNFQFFTETLAERAAKYFALENDLRGAAERGELVMHYQPAFDVASAELCGLEALVRWQHPERGFLPPDEFIPLAEESGLIVPMGRWILQEVCRQIRDWRTQGLFVPRCAVNLSVRQFASDTLVGDIREALGQYRLSPEVLAVEITESLLMSDPERAQQVVVELHAMGVEVAIDDFGTGFSSLAYLKRFPVQVLKLDRSFISGLPSDRGDAAISHAVLAMAHRLNMRVVAEGVETEAQLRFLRRIGCDRVQGYFTGRPVAPAALGQAVLQPLPVPAASIDRARDAV